MGRPGGHSFGIVGGLGALALSEWRWRATRERDPGPDR